MTNIRFDGAWIAPAARLCGHGALRRAAVRTVAMRETSARGAAHFHRLMLDDAGLATFGADRGAFEPTGQCCYPF